jgi:integrase
VTFALGRAESAGRDLEGLLRTESWKQSVRALKLFYKWANTSFVGFAKDPTVGIRHAPSHPPGVRVRFRDGRLYEAVLNAPGLPPRDQSILVVLALGLTPRDAASLRLEEVNLPLRFLRSGRQRQRIVPLSDRAVSRLSRWLSVRPTASPYLFPSPLLQHPISASTVRAVVRSAARAAFPGPTGESLRRRIYATGLRHVYLMRAIHGRVALSCLPALTGIDRLSRLERFIPSTEQRSRPHHEIARLSRRWPAWF